MSASIADRFWSRVRRGDACWEWQGAARYRGGYGKIYGASAGRPQAAHRYSWELHNGPIPDGMVVGHHCDNPACVRPDHLFVGTQADNMRDASAKGRMWKGPRKTHCAQGHEFTPENTGFSVEAVGGHRHRYCRECKNGRCRSFHHRIRRFQKRLRPSRAKTSVREWV